MLVIKVYINERQIDEIQIQNSGYQSKSGSYLYYLRKPEFENPIWHKREKGYRPLLKKVLDRLTYWGRAENSFIEGGKGGSKE